MDKVTAALDVLRAHNLDPEAEETSLPDLPDVGQIGEGEAVYATSLDAVDDEEFGEDFLRDGEIDVEGQQTAVDRPDQRLRQWAQNLRRIIATPDETGSLFGRGHRVPITPHPPEPNCAWYCPLHYFGHGWGIYIREECILAEALNIARYVDWNDADVRALPLVEKGRRLLRAAFYVFFLHEQFHHKVESLGLRLLMGAGADRYLRYKANIYRPTFGTHDCVEESLANAESYRRLDEPRYHKRLGDPFKRAVRHYLIASFPLQPPGYSDAMKYLANDRFALGQQTLQSRVLDGRLPTTTPAHHWIAAPDVIRGMMDITTEIYVVLPKHARPIFPVRYIDPGHTVSSSALAQALTRHHGYALVPGGKGSHVKLAKPGGETVVLPGNQPVLSPGVVKQTLRKLGGLPLSRLTEVLSGPVLLSSRRYHGKGGE